MLIYLVKEVVESLLRKFRKLRVRSKRSSIVDSISEDGITVLPNFIPQEQCKLLCDKIDELIESNSINVWRDNLGSDERIYFANEIDSEFNSIYENEKIRNVLRNYTGTDKPQGMLLAARIKFKENNVGSGGGWHRDSPITHQFKAICYLNDVEDSNGPFQYIKRSHNKVNTIKSCLTKIFKPGQYRYNEQEVNCYLESTDSKVISVTGEAGTVAFADTKGIHRGKPLEQGVRYVLFCYFWHNEIPHHFESLKQSVTKS